MKLRMTIFFKLAIILMLFAALLISTAGVFAYRIGRSVMEQATNNELVATALEKQSALDAWIENNKNIVLTLAEDPILVRHVENHLHGPETEALRAEHDELLAYLSDWTGEDRNFLSMLILDPTSGHVAAATDANEAGKFREDQPFFIYGKTGVYVQNVYYAISLGAPAMAISAPIRSADGRLLGVLAVYLNLNKLNEIITRSSSVNQTQDSFLVNTSHLIVTLPRFLPDAAVLQRGIYTKAVNRCLNRADGVMAADDYRGVPALIAYRWLPERELCLIVKIDQAEAYKPVRAFGSALLLIGTLGVLAASALALLIARSITRPMYLLTRGAQEIGKGNLDYRIQSKARDEIGQLGRAFNQMTEDLQIITASRDELNREMADRQQAEAALRESEARYRGVLEREVEERTGELRQAHEKLIRSERLATLGQLAGGVAHELRNPLGVIMNAVYYIKMILRNPDPTLHEYLELLVSEVHRAERIITDLLNFSRIKKAAREKVAIADLVRSVLEKRPSPPQIEVSTHIAVDLPCAFIDPQQIEQVLDNLVNNAYQAMPDGGILTIDTRCEAEHLFLILFDTGYGITKENMTRIFEPLFTTKAYGIGLGLSLAKELAEINGGSIAVASEPGKGATFTVKLPIYKEANE